jgi:hypothetical protein
LHKPDRKEKIAKAYKASTDFLPRWAVLVSSKKQNKFVLR